MFNFPGAGFWSRSVHPHREFFPAPKTPAVAFSFCASVSRLFLLGRATTPRQAGQGVRLIWGRSTPWPNLFLQRALLCCGWFHAAIVVVKKPLKTFPDGLPARFKVRRLGLGTGVGSPLRALVSQL
jgi:hypothetical protein